LRPLISLRPGAPLILAALLALGHAVLAQEAAADRDAAKIAAGEVIYNTHCAICHGDQLVNTVGQAFDLRRLKGNERPRFDNSVRNGKNQMPPWKGILSDDDIDRLWRYIRANADQK